MRLVLVFLALGTTFGDEDPKKDYFKILGVSRHASKNEIKKAYKQKSLIMHPDKVPPDQREAAQEKFSELNNAYEILIDDDKRQLYMDGGEDALKHGNRGGGGDSFFNFFFNQNGGGGRNNNQHNQKPKALRQYIDNIVFLIIEEHEAFLGIDINVSVIRRVKCPECHGAGKGSLVIVNCSKCNGTGVVNGAKCGKCNGKGKVPYSKCPRCRGGGSITNHTVVPVYVPQGVCSGDELMYSDLGDEYIEVGKGIVGKGRLLIRIKTVPSFPSSLEKLMTFFPSSLLHASSSSSSTAASSPPPTSPLTSPLQSAPPKTPYPSPPSSPPPANSLSCSPVPSSEFPVYTRNTTNPLHVHTTLTVSTCESQSGGLFTLPYFDGNIRTIDRKNQPLHDGEEILLRGQGIPLDMNTFASKNGRHIVSWKNKYGGRSKEWGDMIVTVKVADAGGSSPVR